MKRNKLHIVYTWLLLICFMAGQYMVYSHRHFTDSTTLLVHYKPGTQPKQTLTENCQLCDAMHHNTMAISSQVYFAPVIVGHYFYRSYSYHFISISLILSAGRSPPLA